MIHFAVKRSVHVANVSTLNHSSLSTKDKLLCQKIMISSFIVSRVVVRSRALRSILSLSSSSWNLSRPSFCDSRVTMTPHLFRERHELNPRIWSRTDNWLLQQHLHCSRSFFEFLQSMSRRNKYPYDILSCSRLYDPRLHNVLYRLSYLLVYTSISITERWQERFRVWSSNL